jgi:tripartite-type tricarboxylate transporter receptor subunit TctC
MVATDEWKQAVEKMKLTGAFLRGHDFARFLEAEYQVSRSVLTDLGYAKLKP